jgi:hypothetical protein
MEPFLELSGSEVATFLARVTLTARESDDAGFALQTPD